MIENEALFKLSYGLYVLSARRGEKDNGCIINTAMQITDSPKRISVAVNKQNLTCEMIEKTGEFNVSALSESAPFEIFQHFGFQSGRDTEKFVGEPPRTSNGIAYVGASVNAVISARVQNIVDCGTHKLFIGEVTEARALSGEKSATYDYYFEHIKPKPEKAEKKGYVCKICGYVYEGEELPADFICPICKHTAEDFMPLS